MQRDVDARSSVTGSCGGSGEIGLISIICPGLPWISRKDRLPMIRFA